MISRSCICLFAATLAAISSDRLVPAAENLRALPAGEVPHDARLGRLRSLDGSEFPMRRVDNAADWPARCAEIRTRVLVAAGLHPMPKRWPLHAIVYGKVQRDDYTVERVIFESFPGHYVTGSLYRPKSPTKGLRAAVLCPYGHWQNGRFHDEGADAVRRQIAAGGERFERGGRYIIQARCVQLARMGCVAFVYDMEGMADSVQLPHAAGVRPERPGKDGYLFFSPRAELHGQTMFGLQTWNSVRALDFIESLPDVDRTRIGVTGASGGGTQSMILGAVDDRIAACFPVVMVSTAMQGGCTCENAAYLRIGQGNIDIAAAVAPRPLGLIAADDWTKELQTKGYPELAALYKMLGHADRFEAHFHLQFPHNYNAVNRQHMYSFMNHHLKLGLPEPIVERDYLPLDIATEATVWTAEHPKPAGEQAGLAHERRLTAEWTQASEAALRELPENGRRKVIAEGLATIVGRRPDEVGPVTFDVTRTIQHKGYRVRSRQTGSRLAWRRVAGGAGGTRAGRKPAGRYLADRQRQGGPLRRGWRSHSRGRQVGPQGLYRRLHRHVRAGRVRLRRKIAQGATAGPGRHGPRFRAKARLLHVRLQPAASRPARTRRHVAGYVPWPRTAATASAKRSNLSPSAKKPGRWDCSHESCWPTALTARRSTPADSIFVT